MFKLCRAAAVALTLVVLCAASANATPPIDADGAFVHVITFRPYKMTSPLPVAGPLYPMGWSDNNKGGTLILSDAEGLAFDRRGYLDRSRFDGLRAPIFAFGGSVRTARDEVFYCDFQRKMLRRLDKQGQTEDVTVTGLELEQACQVMRDGAGGYIITQAWPMIFWRLSAGLKVQNKGMMKIAVDRGNKDPARVCGADDSGQPMAILDSHDGHDVALVSLDADLLPKKTLWGLRYDQLPKDEGKHVKALRLVTSSQCHHRADLTVFAFHNHVLVFDGQKIISALRNGDPFKNSILVTKGIGPYAFQVLLTARVLGKGEGLVTVERQNGEVKLFARARPVAPARAKAAAEAAARKGDVMAAHLAWRLWIENHPKDGAAMVAQLENMMAAGWWEAVVTLSREHAQRPGLGKATAEIERVGSEARAVMLRRWAVREVHGAIINVMKPDQSVSGTYLNEIEALVKAHPRSAVIHHASAMVALRAGRRVIYLERLGSLQALVKAGHAKAADYPELFDLFASRGEIQAMKALVASLGAGGDPDQKAMWRAVLLRAEGRAPEALKALSGQKSREAMILRARLQIESGALNEGIISWTKANEMEPKGDPVVLGGMGVAYMRRGLNELAVEALLKAHSVDPDDTAHLSNLAQAYAALDKREDALKQIFTALSKNTSDPLLKFQLDNLGSKGPAEVKGGKGDTIAIMALGTAGGSVSRVGLGEMMATMLTTVVVGRGAATVVERARLDDILEEQKLHASNHIDKATAVKVGKLAGARKLVLGNVAEFDQGVRIDLRLVDAASGQVVRTASESAALTPDALQAALEKLTLKLFKVK